MLTILIRSVIIYFFAVFSLRFMGKRQIGEMQLSELTTAVLLSEMISTPATNPEVPLLYGIIPLTVLVTMEIIISFGVTKIKALKPLFDNKPSIIIDDGRIVQNELLKLRFGIEELMSELRQKDISSLSEVRFAILEPNGRLSVIPYETEKPATKGDMAADVHDGGMEYSVICDGKFNTSAIKACGINKEKLITLARNNGFPDIGDIFLMTVDSSGSAAFIRSEKKKVT